MFGKNKRKKVLPKDLGIKIAINEDQAFYEGVAKRARDHAEKILPEQIKQMHDEIRLNIMIAEAAEAKAKAIIDATNELPESS